MTWKRIFSYTSSCTVSQDLWTRSVGGQHPVPPRIWTYLKSLFLQSIAMTWFIRMYSQGFASQYFFAASKRDFANAALKPGIFWIPLQTQRRPSGAIGAGLFSQILHGKVFAQDANSFAIPINSLRRSAGTSLATIIETPRPGKELERSRRCLSFSRQWIGRPVDIRESMSHNEIWPSLSIATGFSAKPEARLSTTASLPWNLLPDSDGNQAFRATENIHTSSCILS